MATRAKALKKFAKNVLHHDLTGMSETAVLKDLLKQEYNIDAVGNSVVSVLMNAATDAICCEHPGLYYGFKPYDSVCATYAEGEDPVRIVTFTINGVAHTFDDPEKRYSAEELADVIEVTQDCVPVEGWTAKFYIEPDVEHDGKYFVAWESDDFAEEITINNVPACE